ncbi:MAG: hypothetical protein P4L75_00465 [Clostridia bacterium]|nr:hypothetical protein [Clostridia bacterium]MDR3643590.1 hypothetical protein [Clostridia bacterium]
MPYGAKGQNSSLKDLSFKLMTILSQETGSSGREEIRAMPCGMKEQSSRLKDSPFKISTLYMISA